MSITAFILFILIIIYIGIAIMLIWPDCIPCILKMSLTVSRLALKDEDHVNYFISKILKLKPLRGEDRHILSVEVIKDIWYILTGIAGKSDLMKEIKSEQNIKALHLYPAAEELISKNHNPFITALKLSIAGNALDNMLDLQDDATERLIPELDKFIINIKNIEALSDRLAKVKKLVYFTDNCGEIVFDKLFIKTIRQIYDIDITVVTRTLPILNDATLQDAGSVAIHEVAEVIENGIQEPLAGTILAKTSPEVRSLVDNADLLISKGGANYDCLTEEKTVKGRISYLLHGKCYPYCFNNNVPRGSLIVSNS